MQKDINEHDAEFIDALEKASARLDAMLVEQERIEKSRLEIDYKIGKLAQKILHLAALCDNVPEHLQIDRLKKSIQDLGVTDAVREIIKGAERPLTITDVRERLEQFGVDGTGYYQNVGAVMNMILKRLAESGEIEELPAEEGKKKAYVWIPAEPQTVFKPRSKRSSTKTKSDKTKV
jgi:hypothetical protein